MEESTSWKGQSFTLLIFGGIVVLCSIFFVLGMLVGRNQGQRIAEMAFAQKAQRKPQAAATDNFQLDFYSASTEEKPDLKLEPAKEPPPAKAPASVKEPPPRPAPERSAKTPASEPAGPASAAKSKTNTTPAPRDVYLQVFSSGSMKQAESERKRVESKGFKAKILDTQDRKLYRVVVGPYRVSEADLAKSDLRAKGYKDAFQIK